uniref:Protein aurora borealis n=1 Tax=Heligmosomoides polygyrus TaxID=6339 RepID=A0A183GAB6_HELPZ
LFRPFREANSKTHTFSRSTNSFESRILETLHTNTFSPSVYAFHEEHISVPCNSVGLKEFKWSIEELSMLKPVHISQEEIAQSAYSPLTLARNIFLMHMMFYYFQRSRARGQDTLSAAFVPSHESLRDERLIEIAAARMKYSTSSPKSRPNLGNSYRSRQSQTEITIAPSVDFDFLLNLFCVGPSCIYNPSEDGEDSVFNASSSSVGSLRRRLEHFFNRGLKLGRAVPRDRKTADVPTLVLNEVQGNHVVALCPRRDATWPN